MVYGPSISLGLKGSIIVPAGGGGALATVELVASVPWRGATWEFDRPVLRGFDYMGRPFILSDRFFRITRVTPVSAETLGIWRNGLMLDPIVDVAQGWDLNLENQTGLGTSATDYQHAINLDPDATGSPIDVPIDANRTYVKALSLDDPSWSQFSGYSELDIVPYHPFADELSRSASASPANKDRFRWSQINWAARGNYDLDPSFTWTYQNFLDNTPVSLGMWGTSNGERRRRFRQNSLMVLPGSATNYSGDFAPDFVYSQWLFHSNRLTTEQRDAMALRFLEFAIQIYGLTKEGWGDIANVVVGGISSGAGQNGGHHPFAYLGAGLLNDAGMLSAAQNDISSHLNGNSRWARANWVGLPSPGKSGVNGQTFLPEQIESPFIIPDEFSSRTSTRYGSIAHRIAAMEASAIAAIPVMPGGITGGQALLNGGPNDKTNEAASVFANADMWRNYRPYPSNLAHGPLPGWDDLFDKFRDSIFPAKLASRPNQVPGAVVDDHIFTAGVESINYDVSLLTGPAYSVSNITQVDIRHSLDGIQWTVTENVTGTGVIPNLMVTDYFVGVRIHNITGAGPWSPNFPHSQPMVPVDPADYRGRITVTGTPANAAPVNTLAPGIYVKSYPEWVDGQIYEVAPATGKLNDEFTLSVGDHDAHPAPTFQRVWTRDGSPIPGGTLENYKFTPEDAGAVVTGEVVKTNSEGEITVVASNSVTYTGAPAGADVNQMTAFSDQTASTTPSFTFPATVAAGTEMILAVALSNHFDAGASMPVGWQEIAAAQGNASNAATPEMRVYQKTADGTEGGTTINFNAVVSSQSTFCFTEVSGTNLVIEAVIAPDTVDPSAITPAGGFANASIIALACSDRADRYATAGPEGYTEATPLAARSSDVSSSGSHVSIAGAYATIPDTTFDPGTFTFNDTSSPCSITISVRGDPAASVSKTYIGSDTRVNPGSATVTWTGAISEAGEYVLGLNVRGDIPTPVLAGASVEEFLTDELLSTTDRLRFFKFTTTGGGNLVTTFAGNPTVVQAFIWKIMGVNATNAAAIKAPTDAESSGGTQSVILDTPAVPDGSLIFAIGNRNAGGAIAPSWDAGVTIEQAVQIGGSSYGISGSSTKSGTGNHTVTLNWNGNNGSIEQLLAVALPPS